MILAAAILAGSFTLLVLAEMFRNVEPDWRSALRGPLVVGIVAALVAVLIRRWTDDAFVPALFAALLTLGTGELHRRGMHTDPLEGLLTGAVSGTAAAATALPFFGGDPLLLVSRTILAGAVAGAVFAMLYERWSRWAIPAHLVTWAAATGMSFAPDALASRLPSRTIALGAAAAVPFIGIAGVFIGRRSLMKELREEAALGLFPPEELANATHPLRRFGRQGWPDREVRRRFVSLSHELALRKKRQRIVRPELARLYQLDVLKLRMELQEIVRVRMAMMRSRSADRMADEPSPDAGA